MPPDYSAVRVAGRQAYELARHGEKPELRPRQVDDPRARARRPGTTPTPARPTALVEVRCSAGTYIRALARDLGERLGRGAYLGALTRTASGPFRLEDAHSLEEVGKALGAGRIGRLLLPPDAGLDAYPRLELEAAELGVLARGQSVRHTGGRELGSGPSGLLRVVDDHGRLAAMARFEHGRLHPEKVFLAPGH